MMAIPFAGWHPVRTAFTRFRPVTPTAGDSNLFGVTRILCIQFDIPSRRADPARHVTSYNLFDVRCPERFDNGVVAGAPAPHRTNVEPGYHAAPQTRPFTIGEMAKPKPRCERARAGAPGRWPRPERRLMPRSWHFSFNRYRWSCVKRPWRSAVGRRTASIQRLRAR